MKDMTSNVTKSVGNITSNMSDGVSNITNGMSGLTSTFSNMGTNMMSSIGLGNKENDEQQESPVNLSNEPRAENTALNTVNENPMPVQEPLIGGKKTRQRNTKSKSKKTKGRTRKYIVSAHSKKKKPTKGSKGKKHMKRTSKRR
jgi:hypothetical protein